MLKSLRGGALARVLELWNEAKTKLQGGGSRMVEKPSRRGALVPLGGPTCQEKEFVRVLVGLWPIHNEEGRTIGERKGAAR
jgi:hypothetical protein